MAGKMRPVGNGRTDPRDLQCVISRTSVCDLYGRARRRLVWILGLVYTHVGVLHETVFTTGTPMMRRRTGAPSHNLAKLFPLQVSTWYLCGGGTQQPASAQQPGMILRGASQSRDSTC